MMIRVTPLAARGAESARSDHAPGPGKPRPLSGPALVRWTVPQMTNSATFSFIANISAGCHTKIKM